MTYEHCVDYLFSLHRFGIRLGLETMQRLCLELGNPERALKFVHIAGTNGKGSTAAFLDSVLRQAGYRTGLYTSPHLIEMGERIRVGGVKISREEIVGLTLRIRTLIESCPDLKDVSFFEFVTAMALLHFKNEEVQIAVWETGLGGRLDATNVVEPLCCVITRIGYDHMEFLGDTLAKIATEKAGILKKGRPVVLEVQEETADEAILARAQDLGCPVVRSKELMNKVPSRTDPNFGHFSFQAQGQDWNCGLKGRYQCRNALLALETCDVLQSLGLTIPHQAKVNGIEQARWPGRFDILSFSPPWVVDGAHNEEGLRETLASWNVWFKSPPRQIIFACVEDKNLLGLARQLDSLGAVIRVLPLSTKRASSLNSLAVAFNHSEVVQHPGVTSALQACRESGESTLITGSLYLAGEVLALLDENIENSHELKLNG
jgi:dihydrofolate synthase / folylpolyglutamate synthase